MNAADVGGILERVRLQLYRDNLGGALELVERAWAAVPDPRYHAQAERIRGWLEHLTSRERYAAAYEQYCRTVKGGWSLKRLEREWRTWTGRKTWRMVERCARHPEYRLLDGEVRALTPWRVLDAGCGEGRIALTLAARHPDVLVEGLEVSATNVSIAQRLNRFPNATFREGLIEESDRFFRPDSFDLAYAFGVLEHVPDVDETVGAIMKLLRPGGRACFVVPMVELRATAPLPDFTPEDTACHVRVFDEADLQARFGEYPGLTIHRLPGEWRPGRYPKEIEPVEFGSFFVAFSKP